MARPLALVRRPTDAFRSCVTAVPPDPPLDPSLARAQHEAYCRALADGGFVVRDVPSDPGFPDAPFVEDTAVVVGRRALVTRPGHATREGETSGVRAVLEGVVAVREMAGEARLDGGDVLQVGGAVYVGRSSRTNQAGIDQLTSFATDDGLHVVPVEVGRAVLHLKSAVTAIASGVVVLFPGVIDASAFDEVRVLEVGGDDPEAANVVRLPDGRVLVGRGHPATSRLLEEHGFATVDVDVSEFGRAGGGLTCLSIRLRDVLVTDPP